MRKVIKFLLQENGQYSLTRVISAVLLLAFLVASFYLILKGQTWGNYSDFAVFCGGGGTVSQVANKYINSRFNTPQGDIGKPVPKE